MTDVRWQLVTCCDCSKQYRCTPNSDYYRVHPVPATTTNGRCWDCHLEANGVSPQPEPQIGTEYLVPARVMLRDELLRAAQRRMDGGL
jgi:hypothetical protein